MSREGEWAVRIVTREVEHNQIVKGHAKGFERSPIGSKQGKFNLEMQLGGNG